MARRRAELGLATGRELQERLPLTGGDPQPRPKGCELKLTQVLGRLDLAEVDETDLQWCIGRLKGEYGLAYGPFYRKVVEAVRTGREPIGRLMEAVEESARQGVKNRGAAFVAACQRTMPSLGNNGSKPDPEPNRQAHPGSGRSVPDSSKFNQSVG